MPAAKDEGTLTLAREFRDEVLAKTPRGQKYTRDYYQYAGEVVRQMVLNPRLLWRLTGMLERYTPTMQALVSRERAAAGQFYRPELTVSQDDLQEVDDFLSTIAEDSSEHLRGFLDEVRQDMRDPAAHEEFGVRVVSGTSDLSPLLVQTNNYASDEQAAVEPQPQATDDVRTQAPVQTAVLADSAPELPASDIYGKLPLTFEANQGQTADNVDFISRGDGYTLSLTPTESVMAMKNVQSSKLKVQGSKPELETSDPELPDTDVIRMKLIGADPTAQVTGLNELSTKSNYLIGNDPAKWRKGVPNFGRVQYDEVYPGIDLVYYGNQRQLEYDFMVAPGADPAMIALDFAGGDKIEINAAGDLILHTVGGEVRMRAPVTYQEIDGVRHEIASRYVFAQAAVSDQQSAISNQTVGFEIGAYDTTQLLVIDPVLVYSTYLGGRGEDKGNTITVDADGNAYIIGFTDSPNFPLANARQTNFGGQPQDVFVAKLNAAGTALVYSTYLGGSGQDHGSGIAVDAAGNAFITGYTGSDDFPVANALQPTRTGSLMRL